VVDGEDERPDRIAADIHGTMDYYTRDPTGLLDPRNRCGLSMACGRECGDDRPLDPWIPRILTPPESRGNQWPRHGPIYHRLVPFRFPAVHRMWEAGVVGARRNGE
jgi:hypothetical protein